MAHRTGLSDETMDELELVARAARDARQFEPLYRRYLEPVYRYCFSRLVDKPAAEDATGRTFEKALAGLGNFRSGSFRSWLFTIAHNVVIDAFRERKVMEPIVVGNPASETPGPEEAVVTAEEMRCLQGAMARLTPEQREVVQLRMEGMTGKEIARTLGRSLGSVKMLQLRAVERLRTLLADQALGPARPDTGARRE